MHKLKRKRRGHAEPELKSLHEDSAARMPAGKAVVPLLGLKRIMLKLHPSVLVPQLLQQRKPEQPILHLELTLREYLRTINQRLC